MHALLKKLGYKNQDAIVVVNEPEEVRSSLLGPIGAEARVELGLPTDSKDKCAFVLVFVKSRKEIERFAPRVMKKTSDNAKIWFAFPRKESAIYKTDVRANVGWKPVTSLGYEAGRPILMDKDWTAIQFKAKKKAKPAAKKVSKAAAGKSAAKKPAAKKPAGKPAKAALKIPAAAEAAVKMPVAKPVARPAAD